MEQVSVEVIAGLVQRGWTYEAISEHLKTAYPEVQRGFSARNIRRFCSEHDVKKLRGSELDEVVEEAVTEVRG